MKEIKKIVKQIDLLCGQNQFSQVGKLVEKHKADFIEMIKQGGHKELLYAYEVCEYFNMRQIDCYKLKY
jgi:hypothetical protein